jgi:hypothetical protein
MSRLAAGLLPGFPGCLREKPDLVISLNLAHSGSLCTAIKVHREPGHCVGRNP